ncbi:MAG: ABC transporter ATP-binding protein [Defluviitaleaceae bacterium]|nr:ABC transporter ATP-binding protein [Defluviitaleaceae bacterium]
MINIKNISKKYKKSKDEVTILDNISISFLSGESYIIAGKNGVGKSTFLSIISGYATPDSGIVACNGNIGYIPQYDYLFEDLTVIDNINFWVKAVNTNMKQIEKYIQMFDIQNYFKKRVKNLSGGMKKSVAICTSLIHNPDIIIMDEPFSGLDPFYKEKLLNLMSYFKTQNKCIIYTSHSIDEIMGLQSEIYLLKNKKLEYKGNTKSIDSIENLMNIFS